MPTSCPQFFIAKILFKQGIAHDESSVVVQHQLRQPVSPVEKQAVEMARLLRLLHRAFASPVGMLHLLRAVGDAQILDHPSFTSQWSLLGQVMILHVCFVVIADALLLAISAIVAVGLEWGNCNQFRPLRIGVRYACNWHGHVERHVVCCGR
jgi:hypothetical protein